MVKSSEAVLGQVIGKKAPKTARGRRILRKREPQIFEDAKSALIIRGNKCAHDVTVMLRELYTLRAPLATLFMNKHNEHPFENLDKVEKMCTTHDQGLFVFGSSSKKRPFRIIFGRNFDNKLLDMMEFSVKDFKSINSFHSSKKEAIAGSKPLIIFQGASFETNENLKRTKSLLLDYFGGPKPNKVMLEGLETVVVCSTFDEAPKAGAIPSDADPPVSVRRYRIKQQKSGSKLPRVELSEIGPRFTLSVDRQKGPDKDRWKSALKVPKAAKPTKVKNVSKDQMGKRLGRIHLGKQDFDAIHTVHHGESKRKKTHLVQKADAGQTKTKDGKDQKRNA